jgi:hypothetical protein
MKCPIFGVAAFLIGGRRMEDGWTVTMMKMGPAKIHKLAAVLCVPEVASQ